MGWKQSVAVVINKAQIANVGGSGKGAGGQGDHKLVYDALEDVELLLLFMS